MKACLSVALELVGTCLAGSFLSGLSNAMRSDHHAPHTKREDKQMIAIPERPTQKTAQTTSVAIAFDDRCPGSVNVTTSDIAVVCGISRTKVDSLVKDGVIPAVQHGRNVRVMKPVAVAFVCGAMRSELAEIHQRETAYAACCDG